MSGSGCLLLIPRCSFWVMWPPTAFAAGDHHAGGAVWALRVLPLRSLELWLP
jgi:hypothetical protein